MLVDPRVSAAVQAVRRRRKYDKFGLKPDPLDKVNNNSLKMDSLMNVNWQQNNLCANDFSYGKKGRPCRLINFSVK